MPRKKDPDLHKRASCRLREEDKMSIQLSPCLCNDQMLETANYEVIPPSGILIGLASNETVGYLAE